MILDSLELTASSNVINSLMEKGIGLPTTNLKAGRIFYLTRDTDGYKAGAYICTGESWIGLASGSSVIKYDLGLFCAGRVASGETVMASYIAPRNVYMEQDLPGSYARCKTPPLANTSYIINVNDVAAGTIDFVAGSSIGSITFEYSMLVEPGETIEILTPAIVDTAIANVGATLVTNVETTKGIMGT